MSRPTSTRTGFAVAPAPIWRVLWLWLPLLGVAVLLVATHLQEQRTPMDMAITVPFLLALGGVLSWAFFRRRIVLLSAIVLAIYSPNMKADPWTLCKSIFSNPLIIGVLLAMPFAYWKIPLPHWAMVSGDYFAQMTLPLALICIGGTLSLTSLRESSGIAIGSSLMKMVWLPLLSTLGAWAFGFRDADLAILFLYFASPTAAASFVMARAVNGNYQLAAAIIVITTLAAVVTTNIGLLLLQWAGWV